MYRYSLKKHFLINCLMMILIVTSVAILHNTSMKETLMSHFSKHSPIYCFNGSFVTVEGPSLQKTFISSPDSVTELLCDLKKVASLLAFLMCERRELTLPL